MSWKALVFLSSLSYYVAMQVKMEQDVALRQAEEEAMRHHHFKANPLPKSTTEPRYPDSSCNCYAASQIDYILSSMGSTYG